ncbi:MAG: MgtC/SapB family protein [Bacteroidales bacterium]|nr:MgtC/SapB family protein [Bacteroidales bacterium]
MSLTLHLLLRLFVAGLLGTLIGYERELRAKGAGVRTHVLVALGSALFMIISIYGFGESIRFDAARVAAGVVGGLGFLGGGIIMKNKHISGLTTAAGLWVTGAIGLGAGCGMYEVSVACTLLTLFCLEAMHFSRFRLGDKEVTAVFTARDREAFAEALKSLGKQVQHCSMARQGELMRMETVLLVKKRESIIDLAARLSKLPGVTLESLE